MIRHQNGLTRGVLDSPSMEVSKESQKCGIQCRDLVTIVVSGKNVVLDDLRGHFQPVLF